MAENTPDSIKHIFKEINDANQKESSIDLIYEMMKEQHSLLSSWSDSLDNKVISLFSLTALIIGAITALNKGQITTDWHLVPLVISTLSFVVSSLFCLKAYQTKKLSLGLDIKILLEQYVLSSPIELKYWLIKFDGEHNKNNIKTMNVKADSVNIAITAGAIEIISLVVWIIIT